ncbi:unnamed protein product [Adineta steineri]|uniref:Cell wall hydrolase SleB domain-containing protein n=1 Tax=Adineta steineri TaxID=433720 RepID=A0A818ZS44_9BILA|nr:unnamed protein product [Adineta steineri]CAF3771681.1 unnamed protein product [Adineta steineri]
MGNESYSDVFPQTLYHEARGEGETGIEWVAWVIRNRAAKNQSYWGGSSIDDVCRHPGQFECWDGRPTPIDEPDKLEQCQRIAREVMSKDASEDPTGGADHYNNPDKEGYPSWTNNCDRLSKVGYHLEGYSVGEGAYVGFNIDPSTSTPIRFRSAYRSSQSSSNDKKHIINETKPISLDNLSPTIRKIFSKNPLYALHFDSQLSQDKKYLVQQQSRTTS